MMSLAEFIEKYGTHAAQELLDLIYIRDLRMKSSEAREMLIRWKVITRQTKNMYLWLRRDYLRRYRLTFSNTRGNVLEITTNDSEIESLRATIYKRGEESIA